MPRLARILLVGVDGANPRESVFEDKTNVCLLVRGDKGAVVRPLDRHAAPTTYDRGQLDWETDSTLLELEPSQVKPLFAGEDSTDDFADSISWDDIEAELLDGEALVAEETPEEMPAIVVRGEPIPSRRTPRILRLVAAFATCFLLSYDLTAAEPLLRALEAAGEIATKIRGI